MRAARISVLCLALFGCSQTPTEIVAWPGMEAKEFNQLNARADVSLPEDRWDWIGINSPVTLVFREGSEELQFAGHRQGGGVMIKSALLEEPSTGEQSYGIEGIAFNIGGGMERVADRYPELFDVCRRLSRIALRDAGEQLSGGSTELASAAQISARFAASEKDVTDVTVCSGRGDKLAYSITATHVLSDRAHGGDAGFAFFNGSLHRVIDLD